jgi:cytosine/creatinine deaminase
VQKRTLLDQHLPAPKVGVIRGEIDLDLFITEQTPATDAVLNVIAHLSTRSLPYVVTSRFFEKLTDADFMRIAVLLAQKGYDEGGCPIGGVVVNNETRQIVGKGHNTLVQENHPYNHGETSAIRDAGRKDFSRTTIFTTLSPCDVCATLIYMRGFNRVVVGDVTNASGNEQKMRDKGVQVDILEDQRGIELYAKYRREKPDQDLEDWKGLAEVGNLPTPTLGQF